MGAGDAFGLIVALLLFVGLCVYVWWTANRKDAEAPS